MTTTNPIPVEFTARNPDPKRRAALIAWIRRNTPTSNAQERGPESVAQAAD